MRLLVLSSLLLVAACSEPGADDGGGAGGGGGSEAACGVPDTACPSEMPFAGAPCQGALVCDYDDPVEPWQWTCDGGRWSGTPDCSMIVGGACGVPEPAEACNGPFTGTLAGTLEVGPAESGKAFRPYQPGEEAEIVWGPQGGAMIFYRVRLDGEELPSCVSITTMVTPVGISPSQTTRPVRLRCGESLSMYEVLPAGDCTSTAPVETTLRVEIAGRSAEVTLIVPGDAFCAVLG